MLKKMLAQMTHEKLLEMGEADETDWSAARFLKDIYECHSCVIHIAQCYVKGIIPLSENGVFGANEIVTPELEKLVEERIYDKSLRQKPAAVKAGKIKSVTLSNLPENARIIDVRQNSSESLYENIPLKTIVQNPYIIGNDFQQNLVLYCTKGYQSTLAADILKRAGYINVYLLKDNPM